MSRKLLMALVVSALTLLVVVPGIATGQSTGKEVVVVNETTQAVPVAPQGTIQVAGSVNVGNSPTVTIDPTSPLRVIPAVPDQPMIRAWSINLNAGVAFNRTTVDVPDGKIFVVQAVHALANLPAGESLNRLTIDPAFGGNVHLPAFPSGNPAGSTYAVSEQLSLYLDADFDFIAQRSGGGSDLQIVQGTVEGYLVDA